MKSPAIGERVGRLIILSREVEKNPSKLRGWQCRCDCGAQKLVSYECMRMGKTKSCGCLRREVTSTRTKVHGLRHSPEFLVWCNMRRRCADPANKFYASYGGAGISVCDRWSSFVNFYADMGPRPSDGHSIEREDNSGNYEPDNCCWATPVEQANNRRSNRFNVFEGEKYTIRQLVDIAPFKISYGTLAARIYELGWSVERAMTTPVR